MSGNVLFFAWNRPVAGREGISAAHFQEFMFYLGTQQEKGSITSFTPVFLDPHGGDLNGFVLIHGEGEKLDALCSSEDWIRHMTYASIHLAGSGAVRGVSGALLAERMELWSGLLPAS